jgi:hypothetical protein
MGVGGITIRTGIYTESGAKDINGNDVNLYTASEYSAGSVWRFGGRDPRIHVGNPSSPSSPTPNDFKLQQEVGNFSASPSPAEGSGVTVSGNQSLFDYSATVTFDSDVTVTEIGLSSYEQIANKSEARLMLIRDVVSPAVTIPANTPYVIRYRIIMEA